jgi:L-rhamnose mutarotase
VRNHAFAIRLRNEAAAETYRKYHENVWPEIVGPGGALETIGVRKLQIFFIAPLTLFMYVEAEDRFDPERDFLRANDLHPKVREWDDMMHDGNGSLLVRWEGNNRVLNWAPMTRWHAVDFEGQLTDYPSLAGD